MCRQAKGGIAITSKSESGQTVAPSTIGPQKDGNSVQPEKRQTKMYQYVVRDAIYIARHGIPEIRSRKPPHASKGAEALQEIVFCTRPSVFLASRRSSYMDTFTRSYNPSSRLSPLPKKATLHPLRRRRKPRSKRESQPPYSQTKSHFQIPLSTPPNRP